MPHFPRATLIASAIVLLALAACATRSDRQSGSAPVDANPPAAPVIANAERRGDRDLGPGAGKERLGMRQRLGPSGESLGAPAEAVSTFAIDVDTAGYSRVRGQLLAGRRPTPEAVRIEEMVNYFDYAYPAPAADDPYPFRVSAAVARCPWASANRLVRVALKGREVAPAARPALNLVFLIDTSGSMDRRDRLPLVEHGLALLVQQLDARDHLAIVTYAGHAAVVLPSTPVSDRRAIERVIRGLTAGGATNGAGGIRAAYDEAARHAGPGSESRVVLCTDGDFNVGISRRDELVRLIEAQRLGGVRLNVYGFGVGDAGDHAMEALADAGNGSYAVIDDELEARKVMVDEAMGQLVTIAKDVKAQVFFNPRTVASWRLLGYENRLLARADFNDDGIDAGEIGAGHTVTALYEVVPAARSIDANPFNPEEGWNQPRAADPSLLRLRLRWQPPAGGESSLLEADLAAEPQPMDEDFSFAAGVAACGLLLRGSPHRGSCSWDLAYALASAGRGDDPRGLRAEFIAIIDRLRQR